MSPYPADRHVVPEPTLDEIEAARSTLDRVTNRVPTDMAPDTWGHRAAVIRQLEAWLAWANEVI